MGTINGIVSEYSGRGAKDQRAFIAEISERLAGYSGGFEFVVREFDINQYDIFLEDGAPSGSSEVTLKLHIGIKEKNMKKKGGEN